MKKESIEKLRLREARLRMELNTHIGCPSRPLVPPNRIETVWRQMAAVRQKINKLNKGTID